MASVVISGDTSGAITISAPAVAGTNTLTLPVATDTLVGKTTTDTLTNKTLTSPTLTTPALGTPASGVMTNVTGINYDGFKNRIINGAMVIDQRNAGASVTNTTGYVYGLDRYSFIGSSASKFTFQQSSTAPTGFVNSYLITSSAATSLGASDYYFMRQNIEGFNVADLGWGTASAQTVTLSFWVRSSLTGTFGGCLKNSAENRSYPFSYTISSANTFEYKTITIAGDTTGTWLTNNGTGINLTLGLGIGSTSSGTAGAWAGANYYSATGATSVVGTNGATLYITGVQLEKGSTATSFDYRPYGTEFMLCQRYYQKSGYGMAGRVEGTTLATLSGRYIVEMRAAPSGTLLNGASGIATFGVSTYDISALATLANGTNDYRQAVNSSGMVIGNMVNGYSQSVIGWSAEL